MTDARPEDVWEVVIGLECHVQLATSSKLFSPARNRYGDASNTNVDLVDARSAGLAGWQHPRPAEPKDRRTYSA